MGAAKKLKIYEPEKMQVTPRKIVFKPCHKLFLLALSDAGENGFTDFELAGMLNKDKNDATWRRVELLYLGMVKDTATKRASPSGRKVKVWRITSKGIKKAQSLLRSEK